MMSKKYRDSLPADVTPRRLYIFPNRFGIFFIFVLLAMLAGSVNYHNNPGYMMTFLLGGIYLMSFHLTHRNIKGTRITGVDISPVFQGDYLVFAVGLMNIEKRRRTNLKFRINGIYIDDLFSPEPGFSILEIRLKTILRGIFSIDEIMIYSDWPLGLTRAWTYIYPENINAAVYPKPVPTGDSRFRIIESGYGNGESAGSGEGADEFSELKDYVPGDPMQRISWKSLSRGHGLMTKYFEGNSSPVSYIIDWNMIYAESKERKLGIMAHMIIDSEMKKMQYGVSIPDITISPGMGRTHMDECLIATARFEQDWTLRDAVKWGNK